MEFASQNSETKIALDYFKGRTGNILDVGANNGKMLSNSYDLINKGWFGYLVEPSSVFKEMEELYKGSDKVKLFNFGLSNKTEKVKFYESGNHVPNGDDKALVSSTVYSETERWRNNGVEFKETEIQLVSFIEFYDSIDRPKLDYISIDIEGGELALLKCINLSYVGCDLLCIEFNGNKKLKLLFVDYCHKHKMKLIHQNSENLIFAR